MKNRLGVLDLIVVERYRYGYAPIFANNIKTIILHDSLLIGKTGSNINLVYLTFLGQSPYLLSSDSKGPRLWSCYRLIYSICKST